MAIKFLIWKKKAPQENITIVPSSFNNIWVSSTAWPQRARNTGRAHLKQNPLDESPGLHERCIRGDYLPFKRNSCKRIWSWYISNKSTTESDIQTPLLNILFINGNNSGPWTSVVQVEILWPDLRIREGRKGILCLPSFSSHRVCFKTHHSEGLETTRDPQRRWMSPQPYCWGALAATGTKLSSAQTSSDPAPRGLSTLTS